MEFVKFTLLLTLLVTIMAISEDNEINERFEVTFRMPNVRTYENDSYYCLAMDMKQENYLVKIRTITSGHKAHHIDLFGFNSSNLGSDLDNLDIRTDGQPWNCKIGYSPVFEFIYGGSVSMALNGLDSSSAGANSTVNNIDIPEGYGMKVGGSFGNDILILQVHYANTNIFLENPDITDDSGVILTFLPQSTSLIQYRLGVLFLHGNGLIPAGGKANSETLCQLNEDIHPIAYVIHTHHLGVAVSLYKVSGSIEDPKNMRWELIGKGDPRVNKTVIYLDETKRLMSIKAGDWLAGRCSYVNTRNETVTFGLNDDDEMCNIGLTYFVLKDEPLLSSSFLVPEINQWSDKFIVPEEVDRDASQV